MREKAEKIARKEKQDYKNEQEAMKIHRKF